MSTSARVRGFTLIELLVVIGIIGILAVLVLLAINPQELQKKSRDSQRLSDLTSLGKALDSTLDSGGGPLQGTTIVPFVADSSGARTAASSANYIGVDVANYLSILPDDPEHLAGSGQLTTISDGTTQISRDSMRYFFASDGVYYEINAYFESLENNKKVIYSGDGGDSTTRYEVGTKPGLDLIVGP